MSAAWDPPPDWVRHVREKLIPGLEGSGVVVSLVPEGGELDIKFCIELGASIMLDKPIIAAIRPGTKVPLKLVKVADHIIECDLETESGRQHLADVIKELVK